MNHILFNTIQETSSPFTTFDTDSFPLICDCRALSTVIPFETDFIEGAYRKLTGISILEIVSGLPATGIGLVIYKLKDNNRKPSTGMWEYLQNNLNNSI